MDPINPLLPAALDIAWSGVALAAGVLTLIALVALALRSPGMRFGTVIAWLAVVLLVPFIGAVCLLVYAFRTRRPKAPAAP